MDKVLLEYIRSNPIIYSYLREDSSHYRYLLRDSSYIKEVENLAKEKYKQRGIDKIENLSDKIDFIKMFLDIIN